jgi:Flp pilus assembly protein TadD
MIAGGDYTGGREILDAYREGRFAEWWPLWYYLGMSAAALGNTEDAVDCYKRVLRLSPSNTDAMEELAAIYALSGDEVNADKYRKKIDIVRHNYEEETASRQK